jgi:hypothetical protein
VQAADQEKKLQDKSSLFIDRRYYLYAIVRRSNEEVPFASICAKNIQIMSSASANQGS